MTIAKEQLSKILEAALMASGQPLSIDQMLTLFFDDQQPTRDEIREALNEIATACENRGVELKQISSGYRFQAKQDYAQWISRLWEEKPPRYSRALLETLVLVAYRQPITRSEIEDVRGVSVSSHIVKTLLEREWVRVVGHRDVPGKPALYATTKQFLDYFNLKSLDELPTLQEIRDLDKINAELELDQPGEEQQAQSEAAESEEAAMSDTEETQEAAAQGDLDAEAEAEEEFDEARASHDEEAMDTDATDTVEAEAVDAEDGQETRADADEEENEEMLYASSHDDTGDDDSIDDKYADASSTRMIDDPDEPAEAISDNTETVRAIET